MIMSYLICIWFFIGSIFYWHMDVYIAKLFKLLGSSLKNTPSIFLVASDNLQRIVVDVLTKGKLVWVTPIPVKLSNFFVSNNTQSKCNLQLSKQTLTHAYKHLHLSWPIFHFNWKSWLSSPRYRSSKSFQIFPIHFQSLIQIISILWSSTITEQFPVGK